MILSTSRFGELELESDEIIQFAHGLPGFEDCREYVILELEEGPFVYLQAVKNPNLAFIVVDPFVFFPDYEFDIPDISLEELAIANVEDVLVRSIVTVKDDLKDATLNLIAPLVINPARKLGKQIILNNTTYTTRHAVMSRASNKKDGDGCASAIQEKG